METQEIANLLNGSKNEFSKFAIRKWYVIDTESNGSYSDENLIIFLIDLLESSLCDYSDAYILVTGKITVTRNNNENLDAATQLAFKNCAPFKKCATEINGTFVDVADFINIAMPMYNLIEYSNNYFVSSGSLWQFKRDEIANNANVSNNNNAPSSKYKASLISDTAANETKEGV